MTRTAFRIKQTSALTPIFHALAIFIAVFFNEQRAISQSYDNLWFVKSSKEDPQLVKLGDNVSSALVCGDSVFALVHQSGLSALQRINERHRISIRYSALAIPRSCSPGGTFLLFDWSESCSSLPCSEDIDNHEFFSTAVYDMRNDSIVILPFRAAKMEWISSRKVLVSVLSNILQYRLPQNVAFNGLLVEFSRQSEFESSEDPPSNCKIEMPGFIQIQCYQNVGLVQGDEQ